MLSFFKMFNKSRENNFFQKFQQIRRVFPKRPAVSKTRIFEYGVAALAEFCASFMLLALGCMGSTQSFFYYNSCLQKGLNIGLVIMACYRIFGIITGSYINPAITLAAVIAHTLTWERALIYAASQFLGAFAGYGFVYLVLPAAATHPDGDPNSFCVTKPDAELVSEPQAFFIEYFLTTAWVFVMLSTWRASQANEDDLSIRIGFAIGALVTAGDYFTGGSMNPARSLPPALVTGTYRGLWVYFAAPMAASIVTATMWRCLYLKESLVYLIGDGNANKGASEAGTTE